MYKFCLRVSQGLSNDDKYVGRLCMVVHVCMLVRTSPWGILVLNFRRLIHKVAACYLSMVYFKSLECFS